MNPEIRARKKQKRSIERKNKALRTYEEALREFDGMVVSWPYSPHTRKDPERLKSGFQKGIEQLRCELKSVHC
ncbi:hypothetical protein DEAC_c43020 [Desulfosporosinus acididurans]|uniref:Uncharacterized protein n=1 Tax=Desulfosporosinus acididurans TaxID=476652 RepID=A0A0J1FLG0_9FIRM|nr:hypothetical protein [Desulfosporosinus acididurans]KLU63773.1 hypothetical protein DEAC_c43020 [Desulfosporosinus acididurans]